MKFIQLMDRQVELYPDIHVFAYWDPIKTVSPSFCEESLQILNKARMKVCTDPLLSNRIDKLMLPFWYVQLSSPQRYGLTRADAVSLLPRFKTIIEKNHIVYQRESASETTMIDWIKERDKHFRQPAAQK